MKFAFGIITITLVFTYVSSEVCTVAGDCTSTSCSNNADIICQHPDGDGVTTDGGLCTCQDSTSGECNTKEECYGSGAPNLNCQDDRRHCYDNTCICDRFPGSGR